MIEISLDFVEKMNLPNKQIVGIGRKSIFAIAACALGKDTFSKQDVYEVILNLAKLRSDHFDLISLDEDEPETVLLRLILLDVVMSKIDAKHITYKESTMMALGIFLSSDFW